MSWLDKNYRYTNAEESRKPGYLERKFRKIRDAQKAAAEATATKVSALPKRVRTA